ncbi:carboxylesterase family protein [Actinoplanes couchii]|uniref:Carboxylesterase type B domain-containing protein n=1 Tax=Actinoplanes couchii TaxID=403638 RepID=A0ABQ3XSV7_9ACTN|nr:carboxylesterase family protein [Actinoplanes couchii]MDR6324075.1 carboxylesterase type B [Actinoplanes couchii]GID61602.1 hypothetical protein Aco03nite_100060 [Actinoplanes couchii]
MDTLVEAASDLNTEVQTAADPAIWGELALRPTPFAPVVDGEFLTASPLEALRNGAGTGIPLLIGSTRDEARLFLVASGAIDAIDEATLAGAAGAYGLTSQDVAIYTANRPAATPGDVLAAVTTDWHFSIPAIRAAEARPASDTWLYRFDHPQPNTNGGLGACHGADVPFVFHTIDNPQTRLRIGETPSRDVADLTHMTWVSFIAGDAPAWAPYTVGERTVAMISDHMVAADDPASDERHLWTTKI